MVFLLARDISKPQPHQRYRSAMATKRTDTALRERLRAWLWHLRRERQDIDINDKDFARKIGIPPAALSQLLSGKKTMGLDVLVRIRQNLHQSIDRMVDDDPPHVQSQSPLSSSRVVGREGGGHRHSGQSA